MNHLTRLGFAPLRLLLGLFILTNVTAHGALIPDAALESAVRTQINKPSGDITIADLQAMTDLVAEYRGITNLEGLQYASNLSYILLDHNQITDVRPLTNATQPYYMALGHNQITNAYVLHKTGPRMLSLDLTAQQPPIADLTLFAALTNIYELNISQNAVSDLSPIGGLRLHSLVAPDNKITNLAPVTNLTLLTRLDISRNPVTNVTVALDLPALNELWINGLGYWDADSQWQPLRDLTPLAPLKIHLIQINNLPLTNPVPAWTNMEFFDARDCGLRDLSFVTNMPLLRALTVQGNFISNAAPILTLSNLSYCTLAFNEINSIAVLTNIPTLLPHLNYLVLTANRLVTTNGSPARSVITKLNSAGVTVPWDAQRFGHIYSVRKGTNDEGSVVMSIRYRSGINTPLYVQYTSNFQVWFDIGYVIGGEDAVADVIVPFPSDDRAFIRLWPAQ